MRTASLGSRRNATLDAHCIARLKVGRKRSGASLDEHRIARLKAEQKRNGATLDAHRIVWLKVDIKRNVATLDAHRIARLKAERKRNGTTLDERRIARHRAEQKLELACVQSLPISQLCNLFTARRLFAASDTKWQGRGKQRLSMPHMSCGSAIALCNLDAATAQ